MKRKFLTRVEYIVSNQLADCSDIALANFRPDVQGMGDVAREGAHESATSP